MAASSNEWYVVYGTHGIVLDQVDSKALGESIVAQLNEQAPQYNHRLVSVKDYEPTPRRS